MQDLKITLVQSEQYWEDKESNFRLFEQLLENIGETDIIVLPEMFHTGFTMNASEMAEEMNGSKALSWLREISRQKKSVLYTSFIAKEGDKFYNRGVFMFPEGDSVYYDKRQLFSLAKEDLTFTAGTEKKIVSYKGWKILLQICFDLRFPEIQRNKIDKITGEPEYDLMLTVANWPEKRSHHWKTLLAARAIENQAYVVGVNRVGEDASGLLYSGDSAVIDALGNDVSGIAPSVASVKTIVLNKKGLNDIRNALAFLKDRK